MRRHHKNLGATLFLVATLSLFLLLPGCGGEKAVAPQSSAVPAAATVDTPPPPPVKRLIAYSVPSYYNGGSTSVIYSVNKDGEAICQVSSSGMWGSGQVRGTFDKTKFTAAVTAANTGGFFGLSKDIGNNYNQCTQGNYTGMVSINEDNTDLRVGYGSGNSLANAELTSLQSGLKAVSAIVDTVKWESAGFGGSSQTANTCAWGFDLLMLPIDSALSPKAK